MTIYMVDYQISEEGDLSSAAEMTLGLPFLGGPHVSQFCHSA